MLRQLLSGNGTANVPPKVDSSDAVPSYSTSDASLYAELGTGSVNQEVMSNGHKNLAVLSNVSSANYYPEAQQYTAQYGGYPQNDMNGSTEWFSSTFAILSDNVAASPYGIWAGQEMSEKPTSGGVYPVHLNDLNASFVHHDAHAMSSSSGISSTAYLSCAESTMPEQGPCNVIPVVQPNGYYQPVQTVMNTQQNRGTLSNGGRPTKRASQPAGQIGYDQLGVGPDGVQAPSTSKSASPPNDFNPICPHCGRFISQYKGNIRRHINQCIKALREGRTRRSDPSLSSSGQSPNIASRYGPVSSNDEDGYQPNVVVAASINGNLWLDGTPATVAVSETNVVETLKPKRHAVNRDKHNDDPYVCPLCDFVTLYKGNMKRHLSTCHRLSEEDLKDGGVEKLRASHCKESLEGRLGKVCRGRRPKSAQISDECMKKARLSSDSPAENVDNRQSTSDTSDLMDGTLNPEQPVAGDNSSLSDSEQHSIDEITQRITDNGQMSSRGSRNASSIEKC